MPDSTADIINQINYKANFGYTLPDEIPNKTFENDNEACGKYSNYVIDHCKKVMDVWFQDTGIEYVQSYEAYNAGLIAATHPASIANKQNVVITSSPGVIQPAAGAVIPTNLPRFWRVTVNGIILQYNQTNRHYEYTDESHHVLYSVYSSSGQLLLDVRKVTTIVPGSYRVEIHPKLALRTIAKNEYGLSANLLERIDVIVRAFDRSRYTDDEFYPMANQRYSSESQDASIYQTARLLHYHRNPHHLQSYTFDEPTGGYQAIQMFQPHVWLMIADWLATPSLTSDPPWSYTYSPNPFVYYYGSPYLYEAIVYHDTPAQHPHQLNFIAHPHTVTIGEASFTYYTYTYTLKVWHDEFDYWKEEVRVPMISKNIHINDTTDLYIQNIVKRWRPVDDGNMPHPNYAKYPHIERVKHELVIDESGNVS